MKRHSKRSRQTLLTLILGVSLLAACKGSSGRNSDPEGPKLVEPPVEVVKDCAQGDLFWSDAALVPLEAQLRRNLPEEPEYWLGTIDNAVVCTVLRPSCDEADELKLYFDVVCPGEKTAAYLETPSESARHLQDICRQAQSPTFHRCQAALTERLLQKAFTSITDRPRFYKLKSE
ncbi:MAG TPA: hypothetical protein VE954_18615 [Oligoflexus sp.]|uniref:hypothetical protein n=1 Tax=Oligoflexus sp. TaxID=1971216 RepID=UPI002D2C3216|nr:hypothetical protein [Oligoflexus sp.]HYX35114.1 hypothetical protein [Oligoflexus sp.]